MIYCPQCGAAPREDDPMDAGTMSSGAMSVACRECHGKPAPVYPLRAMLPMYRDYRTGGVRLIRICAITRQALREDDDAEHHIRLAPEDVAGELDAFGKPLQPGLYSVCRETADRFRERMVRRLSQTQQIKDDGQPQVDRDGNPVMVCPGGQVSYHALK